ncbi:MAG: cryptochrome/photolyase family protein [Pseudomonadales bacterium]|nr:cryptochrome/photolyase family protein [Pseudomonadales bacterium]
MRLGLILGDQLSPTLATLQQLDRKKDRLLLAEVGAEATYVSHHPQKIALIFSAMRHFAQWLEEQGWQLTYHRYDPDQAGETLLQVTAAAVERHGPDSVVVTHCGEYRLHHQIISVWQNQLGCPVEVLADTRFFADLEQFRDWAQGRKQLRMEYFYRELRQKTGLLMTADGKPVGGQWNFDRDNRKAYQGEPAIPALPAFKQDDIDKAVLALVAEHFGHHPGHLESFAWGTTRRQALYALDHFIKHRLPHFGDFQDAMVQDEHQLFHSLLSPYLNCGLLLPREVCERAQQACRDDLAPLNAVEGFIRQILGWREYVRGIYWLQMPAYAKLNELGNQRPLPAFYYSGETRMNCMAQCFKNTFDHAYAHHIQRLMVTGNFALLAGIAPEAICQWYLEVYADAYEWVELPNTLGMVMHADGGYLGSKPYAASGNYIHKMSDYCGHCHYSVKTSTEQDSCPFNSLYWHFLHRHREQFSGNHRMNMIYGGWRRMTEDKQHRILARAEDCLAQLDEL